MIKPVGKSSFQRKRILKDKTCQEYSRAAADGDHKQITVDPGNDQTDGERRCTGPDIVRRSNDGGKGHYGQCHIGHVIKERTDEPVGNRLSEKEKGEKADHVDGQAHDQQGNINIVSHG